MLKRNAIIGIVLCALAAGFAQTPAPASNFKISGLYNAWGYSQQNFFLGRLKTQDDFIVQLLRLNLAFTPAENTKIVTRFDMAQGWWGVDNEVPTGGSSSRTYNNKDTKFITHVDQAYFWVNVPKMKTAFTIGRMQWLVGNRLLIDNNYDGVQADIVVGKNKLKLGWAKVWEGYDGLSDKTDQAPDLYGNSDARDADLLLADYSKAGEKNKWNLFGFFYKDRGIRDGTAYIIDDLQYNRPRFTPQVTQLMAGGFACDLTFGKIKLNGEASYLIGKDNIANTGFGGVLNVNRAANDALKHDVNDGALSGYNLYVKATVPGKFTPGVVLGMGSGDDDPTKGKGNVNKLRTAGFFYVTEIWEDSIMPDEEGIAPQGLGSPNIRGYREFENTTLLQANGTYKLSPKVSLFGSYTFIRATQPIYAWTTTGGPNLNLNSKDIGQEIDGRLEFNFQENMTGALRGGIFFPGKGAQYLINGSDLWDDAAIELRTMIEYRF